MAREVRTKKVTVTLPVQLVEDLARYAETHGGPGLKSSVVAAAVRAHIDRELWLERAREAWGDLDPDLLAQARASLAGASGVAAGSSAVDAA